MLGDIKNNNSKQNHVHLKMGIVSSSLYINTVINTIEANLIENLLTLERIVNKYSFQKIYLDELNLMTPDIERVVRNVESKLVGNINNCFLKAFKAEDKETILRCLRMYVDLQKQDEAHQIFQKHIVKPQLQPLFTERYLEKCEHDLAKIYLEVKKILDGDVEIVHGIVRDNTDLSLFNFVLNSFWKEFDIQSREGLPHITAPGNPELFQKRFTSTYKLLKYIAAKAYNNNLVKEDDRFQNHLKRFNLPVYFEIKFQQIAGNFESETVNLSFNSISAAHNEHDFKYKPSMALWCALVSCFHEDVYIDQLADHFIRLAMMLLTRYTRLIEKLLKEIIMSENKENIDAFIVNVLIDLDIVKSLAAPNDVEKSVFAVINPDMYHIVHKICKANEKVIQKTQNVFKNHVVSSKVNECAAHLQSVTAIPRLYRRTNRSPPKEASTYMVEAVKPVLVFEKRFRASLGGQLMDIVNNIIVKITNQ